MSVIELNVSEHVLTLETAPVLATNSEQVDEIKVNFDNSWNGYAKIAVFYQRKNNCSYAFFDENNKAIIPNEALDKNGYIYIGIIGINAKGKQLTTSVIRYKIEKGAFVTGTNPDEDIYNQILKQYAEIIELAKHMPLIDDENIQSSGTYSSKKIQELITNSNYKQAHLKQTITDGLNGGTIYISQLANVVFMTIKNVIISGSASSYTKFSYSEDIAVPSADVSEAIGNVTWSITKGSRDVKITTSGGTSNGHLIFFVESVDEYTDETISDIQTAIAATNEKLGTEELKTEAQTVAAGINETVDSVNALKENLTDLTNQFQKPVQEQVDDYLDRHPEATTTVKDKSIEIVKLTDEARKSLKEVYDNISIIVPFKSSFGDCTIIKGSKNIMIDCGSENDNSAIIDSLLTNNISKIDYFICSHYHDDHMGGFEKLLNSNIDFSSCIFYLPISPEYSKCVDDSAHELPNMNMTEMKARESAVKKLITDSKCTYIIPENNTITKFDDGLTCRWLNNSSIEWENYYNVTTDDSGSERYNTRINNLSLCCEITYHYNTMLFVGDIEVAGQKVMSNYIDKNYSLYKMQHHCLATNIDDNYATKLFAYNTIIEGDEEHYNSNSGTLFKLLKCNSHIFRDVEAQKDIVLINDGYGVYEEGGIGIINPLLNRFSTNGYMMNDLVTNANDIAGKYGRGFFCIYLETKTCSNIPNSGYLINMCLGANTVQQLFMEKKENPRLYMRNGYNLLTEPVYTEWIELAKQNDLDERIHGIKISENTDLNDITQDGVYYSDKKALTTTLKNVPSEWSLSFRLEVKEMHPVSSSTDVRIKQILYPNGDSPNIYFRYVTDTTASAWYKITGTAI